MRYEHIIFDLDGTLVDSFQDIYEALSASAKGAGLEIPRRAEVRDQMHLRLDQLVQVVFPNADTRRLMDGFRSHYDRSGYPNTVPYPGVTGTLESMHRMGCRLFVATNKRSVAANVLVRRFDPRSNIESIWTSDHATVPFTKVEMVRMLIDEHGLDQERTVMVGDTMGDLDAALKNGVDFIFASYGYGKLDRTDDLSDHVRIIMRFDEIITICTQA